jgi:hypothetical protein
VLIASYWPGRARRGQWRAISLEAVREKMQTIADYPKSLPKVVPEGKRLVHNFVRPSRRQGQRGAARYWLADPAANLIACDCNWASELGPHYRMVE